MFSEGQNTVIKDQSLASSASHTLYQLGRVLRSLREARGLTQADMETMGISHRYYQRIERGRSNVTIKTLVKIAGSLGVEIEDIFQLMLDREEELR
ncbi:MAG: helix-turn-helix domain-containing protein [Nitrospiria bacterium]